MVLPSTGNLISFNQIRIELGVPSQPGFDLGRAADGFFSTLQNCQSPFPTPTNPDAISEWWSYDHSKTGSFFADGKSGASCYNICNGAVSCDTSIYSFNSTYYTNSDKCTAGTTASTFFISPTACSGGTFSGQTCYEFANGTIVSEEICALCAPLGDPCIVSEDCCSPYGCCDGYCATEAC